MNNNELIEYAKQAQQQAYVPYSRFPVGAALLTDDHQVITGCNIENSSYGLTNCAERTAIFKAISEGKKQFDKLAIIANTDRPISPCGACRQVIAEHCPSDMKVILANEQGKYIETTVAELLPYAFSAEDLNE